MALAAVAALFLIAGTTSWFDRLTTPLLAQQAGEKMPGPMIIESAGPDAGPSYVPAASKLPVENQLVSPFIVTYSGFTPQAQAAFQAASAPPQRQAPSPQEPFPRPWWAAHRRRAAFPHPWSAAWHPATGCRCTGTSCASH